MKHAQKELTHTHTVRVPMSTFPNCHILAKFLLTHQKLTKQGNKGRKHLTDKVPKKSKGCRLREYNYKKKHFALYFSMNPPSIRQIYPLLAFLRDTLPWICLSRAAMDFQCLIYNAKIIKCCWEVLQRSELIFAFP